MIETVSLERKKKEGKRWGEKKIFALFVGNFTSLEFRPLSGRWPQLLLLFSGAPESIILTLDCFAGGGVKKSLTLNV